MEERTDLPVLAGSEARPIERVRRSALPIPARAATGGLVVAATYLLVRLLPAEMDWVQEDNGFVSAECHSSPASRSTRPKKPCECP